MDFEKLAQREARAYAAKGKADGAFRIAWWATTNALGSLPMGDRRIGDAQAAVRAYTDQSVGYVKDRTRVGRAFSRLEATGSTVDINACPPKMAMELVRAGVEITPELITRMIKAERDGTPMRNFVQEITGVAASDRPEGMSRETIAKIAKAQPEVVSEAVVKAAPEVAGRHVARDRRAFDAARETESFDQEAGIVAAGGRVPSLSEINVHDSGLLSIEVSRAEAWFGVAKAAQRFLDALTEYGPVGSETPEADDLKRWLFVASDAIVVPNGASL